MEQIEYQKVLDAKNEAIKRGWDHTKIEWKNMVLNVIYELCMQKPFISANDVTAEVLKSPLKIHDLRAVGGAMITAKKFNWLQKTEDTVLATTAFRSKATHLGARVAVWRSLIYKPTTGKLL